LTPIRQDPNDLTKLAIRFSKTMKLYFLLCISFLNATVAVGQNSALTRIAFGSCSKDGEQQLWKEVIDQKAQLWIWLGDNIYGDSQDTAVLRAKYKRQKSNPDYQQLLKTMPVIGTWDDHDYGVNDGGKFNSKKKVIKETLLEFLGVPPSARVRKHEGVYSSHIYGNGDKKVKVILLDTRYFRDTLLASTVKGKRYNVNDTGDILGEQQWQWLEDELTESDAAIHIIGSSIQLVAEEQGFEKWANFPAARDRFFYLLKKTQPINTFVISGDRHMAEISKTDVTGLTYPLYDFTASGLTHTWNVEVEESNRHRVGVNIIRKNFGMIIIDWAKVSPTITFEIWGKGGKALLRHTPFE
jgi:alkaline phosphatase D